MPPRTRSSSSDPNSLFYFGPMRGAGFPNIRPPTPPPIIDYDQEIKRIEREERRARNASTRKAATSRNVRQRGGASGSRRNRVLAPSAGANVRRYAVFACNILNHKLGQYWYS